VALTVAIVADAVQLVLLPAFVSGAASPFDDALDAVVALVLLGTLGFSGRLALALVMELVPGVDLFPTWTAVVLSIPVQAGDTPDATDATPANAGDTPAPLVNAGDTPAPLVNAGDTPAPLVNAGDTPAPPAKAS
jgi:hypothetical protein